MKNHIGYLDRQSNCVHTDKKGIVQRNTGNTLF